MKIKWLITIAIMLLVAGCSKDDKNMNGELIIEDIIVGQGAEAVKYLSLIHI